MKTGINKRKHRMAGLLAVILVLALVMAGCGGSKPAGYDEESIVGRYAGDYNMKELINAEMASAGIALESDVMSRFILELQDDGSFSFDVDAKGLVSAVTEALKTDLDSIISSLVGMEVTDDIRESIAKSAGYDSYDVFKDELLTSMTDELDGEALEELERNTGRHYNDLYIVGGGAKNAFLNQLTHDSTGKEIKEGDVVVICGQLQNFKGTTYEYTTGSRIISINGITDPGDLPDQPDEPGSTEGITVDGTTITLTNSEAGSASTSTTIDLGTLGYTNAQEMSGEEISLSDGTIVVFDKGTGATTPKYYDGTKGVRMYANNTLTVKGTDKVIAQILLTCDSQSGTNYVGNDTKTVSFSGNSAILTNAFSSNSGGVQLRVQTITITYAE